VRPHNLDIFGVNLKGYFCERATILVMRQTGAGALSPPTRRTALPRELWGPMALPLYSWYRLSLVVERREGHADRLRAGALVPAGIVERLKEHLCP
jgi:hypothetical protein